jgi:hypothetical protein
MKKTDEVDLSWWAFPLVLAGVWVAFAVWKGRLPEAPWWWPMTLLVIGSVSAPLARLTGARGDDHAALSLITFKVLLGLTIFVLWLVGCTG